MKFNKLAIAAFTALALTQSVFAQVPVVPAAAGTTGAAAGTTAVATGAAGATVATTVAVGAVATSTIVIGAVAAAAVVGAVSNNGTSGTTK